MYVGTPASRRRGRCGQRLHDGRPGCRACARSARRPVKLIAELMARGTRQLGRLTSQPWPSSTPPSANCRMPTGRKTEAMAQLEGIGPVHTVFMASGQGVPKARHGRRALLGVPEVQGGARLRLRRARPRRGRPYGRTRRCASTAQRHAATRRPATCRAVRGHRPLPCRRAACGREAAARILAWGRSAPWRSRPTCLPMRKRFRFVAERARLMDAGRCRAAGRDERAAQGG